MSSTRWSTALLLGALTVSSVAAAQGEAEARRPPPTPEPAAAEIARPSGPLPVMVVVLPAARVPDEAVAAAGPALVAQVTPYVEGRPVHLLEAPALRDAIAACADDACVGGQLASAEAQAGLLLRLARTRTALSATLELRDPVSGALRGEAVEGELPRDAEAIPEALAALSAQLEPHMPSPPPPPATLLVTVNVDGAQVQIDGEEVGTAPVSAVEVTEGSHTVMVTMPGYMTVQRQTQVSPSQQARLDVTLEEMSRTASGGAAASGDDAWAQGDGGGGDVTSEDWFWPVIIGVAAGVVVLGVAIGIGVAVASDSGGMQDPEGIELPPILGGT